MIRSYSQHALLAVAFVTMLVGANAHAVTPAEDAAHPGKAIYDRTCAACHNNPEATRAPALASLRSLSGSMIEYTMTTGYMRMQAQSLQASERKQLIEWLTLGQKDSFAWLQTAACKGKTATVDVSAAPIATTFGLSHRNLRQQTAVQAGLATDDFAKLELAWAVAFPLTPSMRSQPVVVGNTVFVAATDSGRLYALDTQTGCLKWHLAAPYPLRSSLTYHAATVEAGSASPPVILAGDALGGVLAVDAKTGKLLWRTDARLHEANRVTGAPVVYKGRVFAPLSGVEINYAREDSYECCKAQGAVIALDLKTGKQLWVGRTMPAATKQKLNRAGAQLWGPSGAPIWNTPAIDEKRNVLYVGTGENNSLPATETSDAVLAFDLNTGERKWSFQATKRDVWNYACRNGANCDFGKEADVRDYDFGGSVMIVKRKDGSDLVVIGQKSGAIWALDPDKNGALVWTTKIGSGGANGGVHWGTATDGTRIFASLNDRTMAMPREGGIQDQIGQPFPGLHALDLETGKILWSHRAEADCSGDRKQRYAQCDSRYGYSPAPLVVDGAVVQGSVDGVLRVFDAASGKVLWSYDTMRSFTTVNGVEGKGGAIDSSPYVAANGTLFVNSGYARFGESPGNVLLAFRPKRGK